VEILRVTIPACFLGVMVAATWSLNRGKDLDKDPEYLKKMEDPQMREYIIGDIERETSLATSKNAKVALTLFLVGILAVIIIALNPDKLIPTGLNGKRIPMTEVLQFVMLAVGGIILLSTNLKGKQISDTKVFSAGVIAVIMIFGISWMSETVIENNKPFLLSSISSWTERYPWIFAVALFCISMFLKSQAATLSVLMPLGFMLNIPTNILIGCIPASYAYFFFCFYPSDVACISFDRTGTTHMGKYILNHSFMIPDLIGVFSATVIGLLLSSFVYG
jgi:anaerobic C4-dicarboxylate transporter DcuB